MRSAIFAKRHLRTPLAFLAVSFCFSVSAAVAQRPPGSLPGLQALSNIELIQLLLGPGSNIRGVLLVGKFRTQQQLNRMSSEDQRNTLITELASRTTDTVGQYQSLTDTDLAGTGELLVYLRETASRTDQQLKTMSANDMRNTVIVELAPQPGRGPTPRAQQFSNVEMIQLLVLGPGSNIRGVLLVGKFRTQQQLNGMLSEDQRNTLITELAGRTTDTVRQYQSLNDADLAGTGALLVYLRETGSRTDQQLKSMSADDMRNTVIVEVGVGAQQGRGRGSEPRRTSREFSLVGEWAGSPDCMVRISKDDGNSLQGNCDTATVLHEVTGTYIDSRNINIIITRTDLGNRCATKVVGTIRIVASDRLEMGSNGWNGCGVTTGAVTTQLSKAR